jgi:hypothetical protein
VFRWQRRVVLVGKGLLPMEDELVHPSIGQKNGVVWSGFICHVSCHGRRIVLN